MLCRVKRQLWTFLTALTTVHQIKDLGQEKFDLKGTLEAKEREINRLEAELRKEVEKYRVLAVENVKNSSRADAEAEKYSQALASTYLAWWLCGLLITIVGE